MRHTAEHLLHDAVRVTWPHAQLAMGPATDEGFYNDFDPIHEDGTRFKVGDEELPELINTINWLREQALPLIPETISIAEAKELFHDNPYKLETVARIEERGDKVTIYWTGDKELLDGDISKLRNGYYKEGDQFVSVDLCAGPHVATTADVGPIALLSVAGAYWRGDERNQMLTRIYGTAFPTQEELDAYLAQLEAAKENDHRKLGQELGLFAFAEPVGPGLPLWTPKGTVVRDSLEDWAKEVEKEWGYVRVATPHIAKHSLFEISGHLPYYKDDMYSPMDIDGEDYYLKGMNCPHHHMIYKSQPHSYRELPLRFAEYGTVYRYEQSGSLFGLMRVRAICQNDAHIYCTMDQAEEEFYQVLKLHEHYYSILGLTKDDYFITMGLPDPAKKDKYHGDEDTWQQAEDMMRRACDRWGVETIDDIGGAAFYGPKIDITIRSSVGREFAISTNQLDLFMPGRFELEYTASDGTKQRPAVIHRAPLGSHERFVGFLIEHFGGAFPAWLAPVQAQVITINEEVADYGHEVAQALRDQGVRAEVNDRNESLGAKIHDAQTQKTPYMLIIGNKEKEGGTVSLRLRTGEEEKGSMLDTVVERIVDRIKTRSLDL